MVDKYDEEETLRWFQEIIEEEIEGLA